MAYFSKTNNAKWKSKIVLDILHPHMASKLQEALEGVVVNKIRQNKGSSTILIDTQPRPGTSSLATVSVGYEQP